MCRPSRRRILQGIGVGIAGLGVPGLPVQAAQDEVLEARAGKIQLAPEDYPPTEIWGYAGQVPGPVLRMRQGAELRRRFLNGLPQASSVHWHGIRIDNVMDGVPGLTQEAVPAGGEFLYRFTVPDAGTYWYHPHNRTWEQLARGLYGPLIVEEQDGAPEVDFDEILMLDDWRLTPEAQLADGFGNMHDWAHAGRIGNWVTVNGQGEWQKTVPRHSRLRLRLINTANARIFSLEAAGLEGWVVALDGMPLDKPTPLAQIALAPAQRADLIVDVLAEDGEEAYLISRERQGSYAIAALRVEGQGRVARRAEPDPLPPNPVAAVDLSGAVRSVDLRMEGGAMGGLGEAMMNGQMTDMRTLAAAGKVWAFNGMVDMPDAPFLDAGLGETVNIAIRNETAWPHAMHLHGHHFRRLLEDGSLGPLRDTLLMQPEERAEILFVADNPGDWLLHCHMVEHAASGMMTWIRVG